jgi:hypothetical protein
MPKLAEEMEDLSQNFQLLKFTLNSISISLHYGTKIILLNLKVLFIYHVTACVAANFINDSHKFKKYARGKKTIC